MLPVTSLAVEFKNPMEALDLLRYIYQLIITVGASTQLKFTCSMSTIEILEKGVKYVQS